MGGTPLLFCEHVSKPLCRILLRGRTTLPLSPIKAWGEGLESTHPPSHKVFLEVGFIATATIFLSPCFVQLFCALAAAFCSLFAPVGELFALVAFVSFSTHFVGIPVHGVQTSLPLSQKRNCWAMKCSFAADRTLSQWRAALLAADFSDSSLRNWQKKASSSWEDRRRGGCNGRYGPSALWSKTSCGRLTCPKCVKEARAWTCNAVY